MGNNIRTIGKLSSITLLLAAWLIFLYVPPCFGGEEKDESFDSLIKGGPFTVGDWKRIRRASQTQESARMAEFYFLVGHSRGFESGLVVGVDRQYGKAVSECYAERKFSGQEIAALLDKYSASGASAFADDVNIQTALFFTILKACNLINKEAEPFREKAK